MDTGYKLVLLSFFRSTGAAFRIAHGGNLLRVAGVTEGLAESNGSLPPGL